MTPMRFDLQVIASWIEDGSRLLDLGCGSGDLLHFLQERKGVRGTGIEIQEEKVSICIGKGLTVLHGDIFDEIRDYPDGMFDYVILSQTLQQVFEPARLISEMLRVGRRGIVSFPNFSHWRNRVQFFFLGRAPVSKELPFHWYDTPNIRVIPIIDFHRFCSRSGFRILRSTAIRTHHHEAMGRVIRTLPNLLATYGIFMIGR
jgi:methionine biosynthesis protein MetW